MGIVCVFCSRLNGWSYIHEPIYLELFSPGNVLGMSLWPHPFLYLKKEATNGTFAREKKWNYRPKNWHTHKLTGGNIGWVPPGHTSSFVCKAKMPKMVLRKILGRSYTYNSVYIWNQCCKGNGLRVSIRPHPSYVHVRPKIARNCTLAKQNLGVADLKLDMHIGVTCDWFHLSTPLPLCVSG